MPRGVNAIDEARLQGRLWTPANLTNRVFSYYTGRSTTGSSGAISDWTDQSGQGRNLSQATSTKRPAYVRNSQDVVAARFDGVDDSFTSSTNVYGGGGSNSFTLLVCASIASLATSQNFVTGRHTAHASANTPYGLFYGAGQGWIFGSGSAADSVAWLLFVTSANATTGNFIFSGRLTASTSTTGSKIARWNGEQLGSGSYTQRATDASGFGLGNAFIPSVGESTTYVNGDIFSVELISRSLSISDIEKWEGWAAWEYKMTEKLNASHRFKNRPPIIGD